MRHRRVCAIALTSVVGVLLGHGLAWAQCAVVNQSVGPPAITLTPGEFYFRDNGTPSLTLSTNPTGWLTTHFDELFASSAGIDRVVRIHLTNGRAQHPTLAGGIDCAWAQFWDDIFYRAEQQGLSVLPVFDVWAVWSTTNQPPQNWSANIYNIANGNTCLDGTQACLSTNPDGLLLNTGPGQTREVFIAWVRSLVARWKDRPNILGWEIFSELDLITGGTAPDAAAFVEAAAAEIRAEDPARPVTTSLAGTNDWPDVSNGSIDFIQIHPYAGYSGPGNLDAYILQKVAERRALYPAKPVFIGESGLDTLFPASNSLVVDIDASRGINQAIWAGAVSGAMNARSLWFEDGYDRYNMPDLCVFGQFAAFAECADGNPATVLTLRSLYANASAPVAAFVAGVDYSNFAPVTMTLDPAALFGATIGNSGVVLGWVRDVNSAAPDWPQNFMSGHTVTVDMPGTSADWIVDFYDTTTGAIIQTLDVDQDVNGDITLTLPDFDGSIGFKIYAVPPLTVTIDIIPAGTLNRINIVTQAPADIPVVIFSDATFDASTEVRIASVRFGPGAAPPLSTSRVDINGDGLLDRRFRFSKAIANFACGDTVGVLTGETRAGRTFVGTDLVTIVPCP